MSCSNIICLIALIFAPYLIKHASSLTAEDLRNGDPALGRNLSYTVAIFATQPVNFRVEKVGNGAIVSDIWILSVPRIFLETAERRNCSFTAVLKFHAGRNLDIHVSEHRIEEIYTYNYDPANPSNTIVMAKLDNSILNTTPVPYVLYLTIPGPTESYLHSNGIVSGYGHNNAHMALLELNFIHVNVEETTNCAEDYPYTNVDDVQNFCGVAASHDPNTGACSDDIGSPLVIVNKIVGLVSETHGNCDDTVRGALYTNVAAHYDFINNTLHDVETDDVDVYAIWTGHE